MYDLFFANLEQHINLNEAEIKLIQSKLEVKRLAKNETLLEAGSKCKNIYFTSSGCVRLFQTSDQGEETNILFCPENWWVSDLISFSYHRPAIYSIDALEESVLIYLSSKNLDALYIQVPKLERFFRILFQNGFALYQRRFSITLSTTAEVRYKIFQKQYPELENRIAQKHIASYLGITPVFLSMIRKRMAS